MIERAVPAFFKLDMSGFVTNQWHYAMPEKQTFADCVDPTFWLHVVEKVQGYDKTAPKGIGDKIVVFKRDAMAARHYMITGIGTGFIRTVEVERVGVADVAPLREDSPLKTRWNPGKKTHEVVRIETDNNVTVLSGGYQTKAEAVAWIADHLGKMAA